MVSVAAAVQSPQDFLASHGWDGTPYFDSFTLQAPANSDANITVAVSMTTTDTGGVTATRTGTHSVIVDAVADLPTRLPE